MFPVKQPISEIESFSTRPRRRVYLNIGICTANFPGRIWLPRTTLAAAQPTSQGQGLKSFHIWRFERSFRMPLKGFLKDFSKDFQLNLIGTVSEEVFASIKKYGLDNHVNNIEWTTQLLNCSLRTNSSMCILKNGRFISKFIFDGEIVKSQASFATPEEARNNALNMRDRMYKAAYNTLILNEQVAEEEKIASESHSNYSGVCNKSQN